MNSVQLHLALTHVPVVLSLVGLIMLAIALYIKNETVIKTSYILLVMAGVTALPVYFTGEEAEEAVEHIAGISESVIEEHEDIAKWAMFSVIAAGIAALIALIASRWKTGSRILSTAVLTIALFSGILMAQTAHLGGQIRHTEMNGNTAQNEANVKNDSQENEHDD